MYRIVITRFSKSLTRTYKWKKVAKLVTSIKRQAKGSINLAKCLYPSIPCELGTYWLHECSFLGLETTVARTGDTTRVPLVTLNWVTDATGRVSPSSHWITSIWCYGGGFPPSSYRTKSHRCDRKASASLSRQITSNKHDKEGNPPCRVELSHIDATGRVSPPRLVHSMLFDATGRVSPPCRVE